MVSKKLFSAVLATLVVFSIVGGSSAAFAQTQTTTAAVTTTAAAKPTGPTIAQIAANNTNNLTTLVSLLKKANLTDVLNGTGNFTIFAPDNAAFNKVNASTLADLQNNTTALTRVLLYHVIPQKFLSSDFKGNGTLQTVNGLTLPYSVNGTKVTLGSGNSTATVTKADINATNGEIFIVDGVLIPPANATAAAATASATASGGFLGLPGFEALYAVAGLLVVAYLVIQRRK